MDNEEFLKYIVETDLGVCKYCGAKCQRCVLYDECNHIPLDRSLKVEKAKELLKRFKK